MNAPDNPSAFPVSTIDGFTDHGMTLLDYFAGQALPSVIEAMQKGHINLHETAGGGPSGFAATAYEIAAGMLAERSDRSTARTPET